MRTTLTLDPDVMAKLRAEMRRTGRSFKDVINSFLRIALNQKAPTKPKSPFVVKPRNMGMHPGLNYDNIGDLLEHLDGPQHP